jgi:uncharacterized protein YfdQ (DUF2303 family)
MSNAGVEVSPPQQSEAAAVAEVVKKYIEPSIIEAKRGSKDSVEILVAGNGSGGVTLHNLKSYLDEYLAKPERRKGTATLMDLASFIEHVLRFKDQDSVLFADPTPSAPKLTAVLDYHRAGATADPRFGQHRAVYSFPLSDEWKAWAARDGKEMSQQEFAELLEDRIADISDPASPGDAAAAFALNVGVSFATPQRLIELSRGLSLHVGQQVKQATNLQTGEVQLQYVTEHTDEKGAPLKIPGAFLITIPVFRGGAPYEIAARLRYRQKGATMTWFYQLYRVDRVLDHALDEAFKNAKAETTLPLLVGSPEA